jgi:hypothetical protein
MKTKKIDKVIIYYNDGTFEEVKAGLFDSQSEENKKSITPSPVIPDFRPDRQKIQEWPMTPRYQPARDPWPFPWKPNEIWCGTSTGNAPEFNKYSITSTGNGNVDLSSK